ncbi:MAG: N-6 DNA methylase [Desertimonas sp.]
MATAQTGTGDRAGRRSRGDFPTPPALIERVLDHCMPEVAAGQVVRVLDPTCGDGRFLIGAARRITAAGGVAVLHGLDAHAPVVEHANAMIAAAGWGATSEIGVGDVRRHVWPDQPYDLVVGNPPFRSPLSAGHAAGAGSGPYTDLATEVLAVATRLARPDGGRVGLVLPQSVLAARDAGPVRAEVTAQAALTWSWWSPRRLFDADVVVCAVALERRDDRPAGSPRPWNDVVTDTLRIPATGALATDGVLGDHARVTANFRDQYYGLVGAVTDADIDGPPLVTSGVIDPAVCHWGARRIRFAGTAYQAPRVRLDQLSEPMRRWAEALLVPKVLVANQTRVVEAVADPHGRWLPSVPVLTVRPRSATAVEDVAAVLTSPVAASWAWHRAAGTGRSATAIRLGPRWLPELPWPGGPLDDARAALAAGDIVGCGRAVLAAYGRDDPEQLGWWQRSLPGRRPHTAD